MEDNSTLIENTILILRAITPLLAIALPAYLAYLFGVKKSGKELIQKRRIEIAEELGKQVQMLIEENRASEFFYDRHFANIDDFNEAMERLLRHEALYKADLERISQGPDTHSAVYEVLMIARIYIDEIDLKPIIRYLELCEFEYISDVMGPQNYFEMYFGNLLDEKRRTERSKLEKLIVRNLPNLVT